jgi:hypothetical protein
MLNLFVIHHNDVMEELTRDFLLNKARTLAQSRGQDFVLRKDFKQETGIGDHHILKYWDSWSDFFSEAGLQPQNRQPLTDDQLFEAARDVLIDENSIPTFTRFGKLIPYSQAVYKRRFGTWSGLLSAFKNGLSEREPDSPVLRQLQTYSVPKPSTRSIPAPLVSDSAHAWQPTGGRRYGPFINFRGLQHEPINEQGVVFLFGMVAFELGYVVESVATGFPDCEAKRRLKGPSETWERVCIEFEFESRSFRDHGHNPKRCDLIVCWKHNWPECPLEVLELSKATSELNDV